MKPRCRHYPTRALGARAWRRSAKINYARCNGLWGCSLSSKHLTIESWIFHKTLIEAILMAFLYRMDIACPNLSSKSWNIVAVSSTGHANTAPLKGEQKFVDLVWLLSEIQIRYKCQVSTLPRPTTYLFNDIVCTRQIAHALNYEALNVGY